MQKKQLTKLLWIVASGMLYVTSTIGLVSGLGSSLSLATEGFLNHKSARTIGILGGIVIQILETVLVLDDDKDEFDTVLVITLIAIDSLSIFVTLGGHINVIWILENLNNTSGLVIHIVGVLAQILVALLGSYGAELSLRKFFSYSATTSRQTRKPEYKNFSPSLTR